MSVINLEQASKGLLDFHNHSTYSDGGDTPSQLVERAKEYGVSAMALTDHHVIGGLPEFRNACEELDILGIPFGTEIGVELPQEILEEGDNDSPDMVILGRNPRNVEAKIQEYQAILQEDRANRFLPETFERMIERGFDIPRLPSDIKTANPERLNELTEDLKRNMAKGENLGKLIDYIHSVDSSIRREDIEEQPGKYANKFFAIGQPGYVKRLEGFSLSDAKTLSEAMNCKLGIAHPGGEYGFLSDSVLYHMIEKGTHIIETRNYFNTPEQNVRFDKIAGEHNLTRSGGSDCHGDNSPFKIGMYDRPQNQVPKEVLEELWESLPE